MVMCIYTKLYMYNKYVPIQKALPVNEIHVRFMSCPYNNICLLHFWLIYDNNLIPNNDGAVNPCVFIVIS